MTIDLKAICILEVLHDDGSMETKQVCFKCAVKQVMSYSNTNVKLETVSDNGYICQCRICGEYL